MGTSAREIRVPSMHLTQTIDSFVMQGFVIASREPTSVTMVKRKEFSILWAVVGLLLCLLPLLIYLLVYASQSDQVVFIRVVDTPPAPLPGPAPMSPDGRHWWDGTAWVDVTVDIPPHAQISPDGALWWDGASWRPRPTGTG
jgi:hypothetical protein